MNGFSAILLGTGSHVPERRLTNAELSKMVDTSDEWIVQRTGIRERRIASKDDTTASLATAAGRRAIDAAGLTLKDIELVIVATATPELVFPSTACFVAAALGLEGVPAFDLSAACSGFLYVLSTAGAFVRSGQYKNILLIGAETLSRVTDYTDRSSCVLFGDGAGAIVLGRGPASDTTPMRSRHGLLYSSLGSDGKGAEFMWCAPGSRDPITADFYEKRKYFMHLRGREVYKFAVQMFGTLIGDAMRVCELKPDDVKLIIPHQVNKRVIDSAMEKMELPLEMAFVNIDRFGNTSSASIPMALDEAIKTGHLAQGDAVIFVAFGAGLTWGNAVLRL